MGIFSKFENKMEDTIDSLGDKMFDSPISPVQIAKKAEKQMRRKKMLGAGKQYAPTLYTVLVNPNDNERLFGFYPTLAGEIETYLSAKAVVAGLDMDGEPLVRFVVDGDLKKGKFDVIAEAVASPIVETLRQEEMQRYQVAGLSKMSGKPDRPPQPVRPPMSEPVQPVNHHAQSDYDSPFQNSAPEPAPAPAPELEPYREPVPMHTSVPAAPAPKYNDYSYEKSDKGFDVSVEPLPPEAPAAAAPTAVFAGARNTFGADSKIPVNQGVPPAHLRDTGTGKIYTLNAATILIGRDNTCNIVLPDVNASRQHAQIRFDNGSWTITDLGSTNGTYVNQQEINSSKISSGDILTIGITNLVFNVG